MFYFICEKIKTVFNEDTLYKAYDKRCKSIPFYKEVYEQQMAKGDEFQPKEEMVQNLVDDIEKQYIFCYFNNLKNKKSKR